MNQTQPVIEHFTTSVMVVVDAKQTIAEASRLLRLHGIRHLPVMKDKTPVGVLSERDVFLIESLRDVDPHEVRVEEAMSPELYLVDPEAPIDQVARHMADRHYGCAMVARGEEVFGIFTTTDALRALAVFQTRDPD